MKDARFLIRLSNSTQTTPQDQPILLERLRRLSAGLPGHVMNLRVTPHAFEFDLFGPPNLDIEALLQAWVSIGSSLTVRLLEENESPIDVEACVLEARRLWDEQRFWEVHEVLEGLWKTREGIEREFVQGIIIGAAAFVHAQKNERGVMADMFKDALRRLRSAPPIYHGWDLQKLQAELRAGSIIAQP